MFQDMWMFLRILIELFFCKRLIYQGLSTLIFYSIHIKLKKKIRCTWSYLQSNGYICLANCLWLYYAIRKKLFLTLKLLVDIGKKVQNGTLAMTVINEIIVVCL